MSEAEIPQPEEVVPPVPPWLMPLVAKLHLHAALRRLALTEVASEWEPADWEKLLAGLSPVETIVVVLHGLLGVTYKRLVVLLGDLTERGAVTRGRFQQIWAAALEKIKTNIDSDFPRAGLPTQRESHCRSGRSGRGGTAWNFIIKNRGRRGIA